LPRIMVILDASSSMLNIGGGAMPAPKGESGWDESKVALTGQQSLFDVEINVGSMQVVEDVVHLGLLVFGHNSPAPGEQKVLVNYGPCMKDNFAWALSPEISHPDCAAPDYSPLLNNQDYVLPDCADPWNGPPIAWEFEQVVGGLPDPNSDPAGPGFDADTQTHMPKCEGAGPACSGSGTYTHLGLELAASNQAQYHIDQLAMMNVDNTTQYRNILITDGQYNGYSLDSQVQGALEGMYGDGITTYVIGFGDGVNTPAAMQQLQNMAQWGSGGNENYIDADNQQELEMALAGIIEQIDFDPCCGFNDCSENGEPTTGEVDPEPGSCTTDEDCEDEEICVIPGMAMFGTCEPDVDCMNDDMCEEGEVCTEEGMCIVPPCMSDDDCGEDEVCNIDTGICEAAPCPDVPCEGNLVCNEETGQCQPGVCPDDFQCQDGEACVDGMCLVQSCPDVPCADGETCIDMVCVPDDPTDEPTDSNTDTNTDTNTDSDSDSGSTDPTTTDPSAGPDSNTDSDSETDTDTDTDGASTTNGEDDEGCGCTTTADENKARGLFGTLMALGFAGFIRRRRRN
ncbi:MAG: MYXO-CTERM sorting domain-containing protein, partial [Nannocystaceae bacterium]